MNDTAHKNHPDAALPIDDIDRLTGSLQRFMHIESASGLVLLAATAVALVLANSSLSDTFLAVWKTKMSFGIGSFQMNYSLQHWINDGLMAIFFFVVGLEVKRELVIGELRELNQAILPVVGAIGGMLVPALVYLLVLGDNPGGSGWGIPMATDIAFVVGCLAVLGSRVPSGLRVMLLSLAIADDIGAILVIAIGYTESINILALALGVFGIILLYVFMRIGVRSLLAHLVLMFLVWLAFHESGIHATIAGVIFGLMTPAKAWVSRDRLGRIVEKIGDFVQGDGWGGSSERYAMLREMETASQKSLSPLERFETALHPWVGFVIMPIFALANAGVVFKSGEFTNPVAVAVLFALFLGKPIGVTLFSWFAVRSGFGRLPDEVSWPILIGGSFLTGIGFTMALFISSLALDGSSLDAAKVGVLIGSFLSAVLGMLLLVKLLPAGKGTG